MTTPKLPTALTLTTAHLILEPSTARDASELFDVLNDTRLYTYTGGAPQTLEDLRTRYLRLETQRSPDGSEAWLNWTIRLQATRRAIGTLQATVTSEGIATVAWVIGYEWQHRGYATESAHALIGWLMSLDTLLEVRAFIHPQHEASSRIARACSLQLTSELVDGEVVWTMLLPSRRS
jgi:RimJ/RimL family protein N-acetyltransferase